MLKVNTQLFGGRGAVSSIAGNTGSIPSNVNKNNGSTSDDRFFGTVQRESQKYFYFDQCENRDSDTCIVMTNNIKVVKGNPVLVTGNNTAIYLKNWQFRLMESREGMTAFAVKVNKNYFKEYTFKNNFDGLSFEKKDTFESLRQAAYEQHKQRRAWKSGGTVTVSNYDIKNKNGSTVAK